MNVGDIAHVTSVSKNSYITIIQYAVLNAALRPRTLGKYRDHMGGFAEGIRLAAAVGTCRYGVVNCLKTFVARASVRTLVEQRRRI